MPHHESDDTLLESERLIDLFEALPAAVAVMRGRDHVFEFVNARYVEIVARPAEALVGKPLVEALPGVAEQGFGALIDQVLESGEPYYGTEVPVQLDRAGVLADCYFDFVYVPLPNATGVVDAILAHGTEVTASVVARQQIEALARDLEVQHASLHTVIEGLPAGVVICDASGSITHANSQWREFYGVPIDGLNDISSWQTFEGLREDGSMYAPEEYPLARTILDGETVFGEQLTFRRSGVPDRTIEVNSAPIRDAGGAITRGVAVFSDVTERLTLQSELAERRERARAQVQFERVFEAAGDGIWVLDAVGRTVMMNSSAQELVGYSFAEMEGRSSHEFIHHTRADGSSYDIHDCPIHRSVQDGVACQVDDEVFWRKDGSSFPVSYQSTPLFDGDQQIGAVQVFRDRTAQLEAEAAEQQLLAATESQRQALQLNDDVLQGLTAAKMALELDDPTYALALLDETMVAMRGIINDLLDRGLRDTLVRTQAPVLPE